MHDDPGARSRELAGIRKTPRRDRAGRGIDIRIRRDDHQAGFAFFAIDDLVAPRRDEGVALFAGGQEGCGGDVGVAHQRTAHGAALPGQKAYRVDRQARPGDALDQRRRDQRGGRRRLPDNRISGRYRRRQTGEGRHADRIGVAGDQGDDTDIAAVPEGEPVLGLDESLVLVEAPADPCRISKRTRCRLDLGCGFLDVLPLLERKERGEVAPVLEHAIRDLAA